MLPDVVIVVATRRRPHCKARAKHCATAAPPVAPSFHHSLSAGCVSSCNQRCHLSPASVSNTAAMLPARCTLTRENGGTILSGGRRLTLLICLTDRYQILWRIVARINSVRSEARHKSLKKAGAMGPKTGHLSLLGCWFPEAHVSGQVGISRSCRSRCEMGS
jgi:hypothetical protein